ncbi:MAG: hypothetical protein ABI193_03770, partial [Minicystis sp.]
TPPAVITVSIEMIVPMRWPPGIPLGLHQLSEDVTHKGWTIVLAGHDCGPLIPDLTIPPLIPNLWYAIMWPFSSRKMSFSASTVKANGNAIACAQLPLFGLMTCGDIATTPTAFPLTAVLNSLDVGMTWLDIEIGWMTNVASMTIDLIFSLFSSAPEGLSGQFASKFFPWKDKANIAKAAVSSLTGLAISAGACQASGGEYPVSLNAGMSSPYFGFGASVSYSKGSGVTVQAQGSAASVVGSVKGNVANPTAAPSGEAKASLLGLFSTKI